ncbi:hypothetical protein EVB91_170 [Rhizobium phage RHph_I1_18]|nr:hypothetical protein EVB91_170 [Rhizobium phage RHph_I1_18]
MSLMSRQTMFSIAEKVRPHITPFLEANGGITNDELKKLVRDITGHHLRSDRTLDFIQEDLCEV